MTPTFLNRTSLQLAELTVLRLEYHTVKLRFTLAGTPPPSGEAWLQGRFTYTMYR